VLTSKCYDHNTAPRSKYAASVKPSPGYLRVVCPACGALSGRPCRGVTGVSIVNVHWLRAERAAQRGALLREKNDKR